MVSAWSWLLQVKLCLYTINSYGNCTTPLRTWDRCLIRLMGQLAADCALLEELRVMDYSLLLGVHVRSGGWTSSPPVTDRVSLHRHPTFPKNAPQAFSLNPVCMHPCSFLGCTFLRQEEVCFGARM